ncbi:YopX family protein [Bacillus cereus]|uniref:YopX family protein n=1 Tax=Bacillus cereus TaxID=1396 RepID=UPI001E5A80D5|nr:YopX family protein [Bacillus cereus]MCC2453308.1 YopX family protein [Bacillus cereus]
MREIKFRAWVLKDEALDGLMENTMEYDVESFHDPLYEYKRKNIILMQYAGLKDKNGKEIYEGDILDLSLEDDSALRCEIVYQAPSFCRKWHRANTIHLRQREIEPMAWNTHILYEVIGNIYENPELLER